MEDKVSKSGIIGSFCFTSICDLMVAPVTATHKPSNSNFGMFFNLLKSKGYSVHNILHKKDTICIPLCRACCSVDYAKH